MTMRGLPALLVALACPAWVAAWAASADEPEPAACHLSVTPSKQEVTLGERFTVEVAGEADAGTTWSFPEEVTGEDVELRAKTEDEGDARPGTQRYDAAAFALGEVALPPIEAGCKGPDGAQGKATHEPVSVNVVSVLPKDPEDQGLADVHPPVRVSIAWPFWVALGALALAVGGLAIWLWRRRRSGQPEAEAPVPEIPPAVEARRGLDRLSQAGFLDRGDFRGFYIELTTIAKAYLERRLGAPVEEMTSSEMLAFLRARPEMSPVAGPMRDLATVADFIKFGRGGGQRDEATRHLESVRELVDGMERIMSGGLDSEPAPATKERL